MKILGIDTSGQSCSVAVTENLKLLGETRIVRKNAHSEILVIEVQNLLEKLKLKLSQFELIALTIGPGSFTGLRIGLSVAKGLAFAKDLKIIGVPTDLALAYGIFAQEKISVALDAFQGQIYFSEFSKKAELEFLPERKSEIQIFTPEDFPKLTENSILIGDALKKFKLQDSSENFQTLPEEFSLVSALSVARIGFLKAQKNEFDDLDTLSPLYIKGFKGVHG
ncbi:MAG: tRNA (adenosine(37)-N6)-threonylcarbamoyltransferase complex dimerization subunit type 1 TsaB [Calditrichaeota bacterium]|nr:MAG: tRNA (adenosine(37)-N6)-threonylcarbamoyltransferase complex dimerization subunit type 1 TsaB [Calditrichota bacterium]